MKKLEAPKKHHHRKNENLLTFIVRLCTDLHNDNGCKLGQLHKCVQFLTFGGLTQPSLQD